MPIVPAPDDASEPVASNVALPRKRWEELDEIVDHETKKDAERVRRMNAEDGLKRKGRAYTRTKILDFLLVWAIAKYWEEQGGKPKQKK